MKTKEMKGITLIALVITIVVLLILAGVSINLLLGDNGIITKAKEAKDSYSKSAVKEKVGFLLNEYKIDKATGENAEFAKFLRKNLQVGVAENEDATYSFILGDWQIVTSESEIISIEKFKLDVDRTFSSVDDMKNDTSLAAGKIVKTEGYYNKNLGGGAYYDIVSTTSLSVDNAKCIQLDNGLYAELHAINDTVSVNQFGAYGDGEHDDAEAIQLVLNSDYRNITFDSNRYKFGKNLRISIDNTHIIGNNATLFWNEEVKMPWEQIGIIGVSEKHVKNITISDLNFENGDVSIVENPNESIQLRGAYCDNIEINNCKFNVYEIENNKSRQITNLWFHTEWKNITIENCDLKNLTNSNIGGNIWMSNFSDSYISQNAIIKNNYIQKSCHDEVIGVWGGNIDNVLIKNNNIYVEESKVTDRSRMNFTFGNDGILTNLQFIDNNINCQSKDFFIYINGKDGSKNIYISNNKIRYSVESNEPIIYAGMINNSGKNDNVEVSSNEIEYLSNSVLNVFSATKEQYVGNKIKISANTRNLFSGDSEYYDNIFEINGDVQERIINNISIFKNNMITINGNAPPYIINPQKNLARDLNIENNKFILNDTEEWNVLSKHFIFLYNIELNNYNINILNNTLICPNQSTMQYLIQMHSINDIVQRTINMENNKYDIFKDIVFYNNKINHKVLVDGIEIKDSTILE